MFNLRASQVKPPLLQGRVKLANTLAALQASLYHGRFTTGGEASTGYKLFLDKLSRETTGCSLVVLHFLRLYKTAAQTSALAFTWKS